jgi:hypothetical protein
MNVRGRPAWFAVVAGSVQASFQKICNSNFYLKRSSEVTFRSARQSTTRSRCTPVRCADWRDLGADALTEIDALSLLLVASCRAAHRHLGLQRIPSLKVHFDNPESFYKVFGPEMRAFDRGVLAVVPLNTRFRLIKFEELSQGTGQRDFCAFLKPPSFTPRTPSTIIVDCR